MTDFSSEYKFVNIVDSTIDDINSELILPVVTGSTQNSFQVENAQSATNINNININIVTAGFDKAINRHLSVVNTITLRLNIAGGNTAGYWDADAELFNYGETNSFQAFPFNTLITTASAQINNTNVSVQTRSVMAALLKMYKYDDLGKYNSLTPSLVDSFYQQYSDGLGTNNNALGNYSVGSYDKAFYPRGSYAIKLFGAVGNIGTDAAAKLTNYKVVASAAGTSPYTSLLVEITTTEPILFLSPFISSLSNNQAGFMGVSKINLSFNLGNANRTMSNASTAVLATGGAPVNTISSVDLVSVTASKALMNYLTIPPTLYDKMERRNVLPYLEYLQASTNTGITLDPNGTPNGKVTETLTFTTQSLSQIPSKIIIYVGPDQNTLTTYDSNYFLVINSITLTFANKTGLLSNCQPQQLYEMSVRNGVEQSYYEWSGFGVSSNSDASTYKVPTIGSVLCLDPSIDLCLDTPYSDGSTGFYNLQFQVNVTNQTKNPVIPTIYMIAVNSGVFTTIEGQSIHNTGLLDQQTVIETKMKVSQIDSHTYQETIMGGSLENLGSITKHLKHMHHKAAEKEHDIDSNANNESMPRLGSGMDGSGMRGGMPYAGKERRLHKYM